ncbi:MAG TPA: COX15/CtaA family protein, partial [Acidimicrobiales bacterium]|nr:COX15/CtaA family protein [Acidimicrobiales bacterium]
ALVVTGGAVRLTGSGLGCADWPECSAGHLIAQVAFHPLVEDVNRLISVAVTALTAAVFLAAFRRVPYRGDLAALSGGLVGGLIGQIVLGGLVVLFKLNPYLVALHFLLTLAILADAIVLHHLAGSPPTRGVRLVDPTLAWLGRLLLAVTCLVVAVGTVVSGAGPHAGGAGAKRIGISFQEIAQLHSDVALFLVGLTLAALFAFHQAGAPAAVQRRGRTMLEVMAVQGALGYTQYFLHDAAGVVEVHLLGATCVFSAVLLFYLGLYHRPAAVGGGTLLAGAVVALDDAVGVAGGGAGDTVGAGIVGVAGSIVGRAGGAGGADDDAVGVGASGSEVALIGSGRATGREGSP